MKSAVLKLNDLPATLAFLNGRTFLICAPAEFPCVTLDLEGEEILDWSDDALETLKERGWLTLWTDEDGLESWSVAPCEARGSANTLTWEEVEVECPDPSPEETAELTRLLTMKEDTEAVADGCGWD